MELSRWARKWFDVSMPLASAVARASDHHDEDPELVEAAFTEEAELSPTVVLSFVSPPPGVSRGEGMLNGPPASEAGVVAVVEAWFADVDNGVWAAWVA